MKIRKKKKGTKALLLFRKRPDSATQPQKKPQRGEFRRARKKEKYGGTKKKTKSIKKGVAKLEEGGERIWSTIKEEEKKQTYGSRGGARESLSKKKKGSERKNRPPIKTKKTKEEEQNGPQKRNQERPRKEKGTSPFSAQKAG